MGLKLNNLINEVFLVVHEFSRTEMLIGTEGLNKLKQSTVAVIGIGGVGSYAVEGLVRSGVGGFVLIDGDCICLTNINRQIHATGKTIGRPKVEVMKERILEINANARVTVFNELYTAESAERLLSTGYSYVVDAIDMVSAKLDLIERCSKMNIPVISSMGAGNRLDPTRFEVADIFDTSGCPLARVIRRELKKRGIRRLKVVYSKEPPVKPLPLGENCGMDLYCSRNGSEESGAGRRSVPGSVSFVPPVAGLIIASEVVKDIVSGK